MKIHRWKGHINNPMEIINYFWRLYLLLKMAALVVTKNY